MRDNIILRKTWQDREMMELHIICSSAVATAEANIYVSESLLDDLIYQIMLFLGGSIKEGVWANENRGNSTTACVDFRFFAKDKQGHILIEAFIEIDDGGDYAKHNCCFYINTEYGLLMNFCEEIEQLKSGNVGYEIQLHEQ